MNRIRQEDINIWTKQNLHDHPLGGGGYTIFRKVTKVTNIHLTYKENSSPTLRDPPLSSHFKELNICSLYFVVHTGRYTRRPCIMFPRFPHSFWLAWVAFPPQFKQLLARNELSSGKRINDPHAFEYVLRSSTKNFTTASPDEFWAVIMWKDLSFFRQYQRNCVKFVNFFSWNSASSTGYTLLLANSEMAR